MIILDKPVKGSDLIRDFLLENGVATARFRKKQLFTPYDQRMRIMSENLDRPEEFRVKSLRRRLTKLDRALTDDEAYALDRALNAWLSLNGKSKSVDPGAVYGGCSSGDVLSDYEFKEANLFHKVLNHIGAQRAQHTRQLFCAMAPWDDNEHKADISDVVKLARSIKWAYDRKEQKKNLQS